MYRKSLVFFLVVSVFSVTVGGCSPSGSAVKGGDNSESDVTTSNSLGVDIDASELRIPPLEPAQALSAFQIKDGLHIEQVASEPQVVDPVAMSFDEYGRLYVIEMRWYPVIDTTEKSLGRIRLLEDTTGDGHFDKSTVFADAIRWPTALFNWEGGVFVAATPDLLYLKDNTGDGVADTREVVMTGFGTEQNPAFFVQQMPNSFRWGLDNRIYGVTSGSGGIIRSARGEGEQIGLRGDDFSFDPRSLEMTRESGGLQHGMSFDSWGRKYINRQGSHIEQVMYEERYEERNPAAPFPNDHVSIAEGHHPSAKVFRISEKEPWRELRTRWWVEGRLVRDENDNLALQAPGGERETMSPDARSYTGGTYITAASGVTVYAGSGLPERYRGSSFIADPAHNIVHRDSLYSGPNGVQMRAVRPVDEQETEFIASSDNWFRPVQFANGPDGALYMADLYREVIDLPSGIPAPIQRELDLRSGNDRGRIYRIVPEGFEQPEVPRLGEYRTEELVATLDHPNAWHRKTASRLLYERQDPESIAELESLFSHTDSPLGRLHAMYALAGQEALTASVVLAGLRDSHPGVRRHAVQLAERLLEGGDDFPGMAQVTNVLLELSKDPDQEVRYQVAFSLGVVDQLKRVKALVDILRQNPADEWIHAAILSSLDLGGEKMFAEVTSDRALYTSAGGDDFLEKLALMIGIQNEPRAVEEVMSHVSGLSQDTSTFALTTALGHGLRRAGSSLQAMTVPELEDIIRQATAVTQDESQDEPKRIAAIHLLGLTSMNQGVETLLPLLGPDESMEVNVAAIESMSDYEGAEIAGRILQKWPVLTPRVRRRVVTFLLARPERITQLLDAIENDVIAQTALTSSDVRFLRSHNDLPIQDRARKLLEWGNRDRQQVIDSYSTAVEQEGDPSRGGDIYREKCAQCHRVGDEGYAIGPDLGSLGSSKSKLLVDIIDPSRNVEPNTRLYTVVTETGETVQGILANETSNSITLRRPFGPEVELLRTNVASLESTEQSLMPNGLEAGLSTSDMADLLEFIQTAGE